MAKIQLKSAAGFELFDEDYYVAEVQSCEVVDHEKDDYHDAPYQQLKWVFRLHIPDREDKPIFTTWTSLSLHKKSKLPKLLEALSVDSSEGGFDSDAAIGEFCRINMIQYTSTSGVARNKAESFALFKGKRPASAIEVGASSGRVAPSPARPGLDDGDIPF